jgi:hypothetical protein
LSIERAPRTGARSAFRGMLSAVLPATLIGGGDAEGESWWMEDVLARAQVSWRGTVSDLLAEEGGGEEEGREGGAIRWLTRDWSDRVLIVAFCIE